MNSERERRRAGMASIARFMDRERGEVEPSEPLVAPCPCCGASSSGALMHMSCGFCGHAWGREGAKDPRP